MLSIANVGAAQASSYYEKDGYYARMENQGDHWQGKLKEKLNLPDTLTKEDFNKLVNERKERAGYDLCFSAPKSVSVAMTLDDETRQNMVEAHNKAVKNVLEKIEQREIGARVTKDGVTEHIKTGNMIAGCFNHYVSRNSDPQLHTHAVILNKTKYKDKFYAVDNPDLYKNKIMYGQLYRNALVKELMSKGYEITVTDSEKGFFELKGIEENVLEQFSSRRQEIEEKLKDWGTYSSEAASKAALVTRKAKEHKNLDLLIKSWRETIIEVGGIKLDKNNVPIVPTDEQKRLEFQQAIVRLEKTSVAFTERDLKKAVLAAGVSSGLTEDEYEKFVKTDTNLVSIDVFNNKRGSDGEAYYTTRKNIEIEKEVFLEVSRTKNAMSASAIKEDKAQAIINESLKKDNSGLSEQQFNAVMHIATSKDQYSAIQGLAGTGKTHMLNYARIVLETEGYTVKGACFTGKAAQGLQEGAKIDSKTIHSFLNQLEREAGNSKKGENMQNKVSWNLKGLKSGEKEAWIVDEASMVDNNILRHLMEAARRKNAKLAFDST